MGFFKAESYRKGVISSIILNAGSKVLTFLNSAIIAYFFGTSTQTDIYYYVFALFSLIAGLVTVINTAVVLPEGIRLREQVSETASRNYFNFFLYFYIGISLVVTAILLISPGNILAALSNFDQSALTQNEDIILYFLGVLFLMIISQHLKDILAAHKFFTVPIIISILNGLLSIIFLFVYGRKYGIAFSCVGILIGYFISIVFQVILLWKKLDWSFKFRRALFSRSNKQAIAAWYTSNFISLICANFYLYLLSGLAGGVLTSFNIAQQLSLLPAQFITMQIMAVAALKFNESYSKQNNIEFREVFYKSFDVNLFAICAAAALLYINADSLISFFFQRGKFDEESAKNTSYFLRFLTIGLPFVVAINYTSIALMAAQKVRNIFGYQIISNLVLAGISIVAFRAFGIVGYLIGLLIYQALNNLGMIFLYRHLQFINYFRIIRMIYYFMLVNAAIVLLIVVANPYIRTSNIFLNMAIDSSIYLVLLYFVTKSLKIAPVIHEEIITLINKFGLKKLRK